MKITSVCYSAPTKQLTNSDILERLDCANPETAPQLKSRYLSIVEKLLIHTGAQTRNVRDLEKGETAQEHILKAMSSALSKANMEPSDIDLLIYCGVGRGFLEPANAYFFAKSSGMTSVNCFDITDACMSWIRALHLAHDMQRAGSYRNVMVINGEFHYGIHDNWAIRDLASLDFTFPMYTIGEAATATILTPSDQPWQFSFRSRPEHADLCTIPLPGFESFHPSQKRIGLNGYNKFVSWGQELLEHGNQNLRNLLESIRDIRETTDLFMPHAPSERVYRDACQAIGLDEQKIYLSVYREFGNIVSASVPVGLASALKEGRLKRGDRLALVPASAGLVAAVVQTVF